jgi:cytochrome c peroxidase
MLSLRIARRTVGLCFVVFLAAAVLFSGQSQRSLGESAPPQAPSNKDYGLAPTTQNVVDLGRALFGDVNLSNPPGQSCATCHGVYAGFKFPLSKINSQSGIAPGAVKGRFGNRIPPTLNYAAFLPAGPPQFSGIVEAFAGGLFWDGRATGLADQATHPFQDPNEMNDLLHNVGDPALVVQKLKGDGNAWMFRQVYGYNVFSQDTTAVFGLIAQSIAAYESSPEISPFSSKYDQFIHGKAKLSQSEWNGLRLVTGSTTGRPGGPSYYKNANCADCHGIPTVAGEGVDLWTNSCFDNIGVPKNPANPYYNQTNPNTDPVGFNPLGSAYVDLGLGGTFYPFQYNLPPGNLGPGSNGQGDFLGINGDFKAPTLRNVDKRPSSGFVKRYTHNGFFTDLKTIVHFYNTRNLTNYPGEVIDFTTANPYANLKGTPLWPPPEYPNPTTLQNASGAPNSSSAQVGNLGLTDAEENDIVAFLKTLTDGYGQSFAVDPNTVQPQAMGNVPTARSVKSVHSLKNR